MADVRSTTKRLVDAAGAAAYLSTTERHVRELTYRREIPFIKVGPRLLRFDVGDLDAWIDENRVAPREGGGAA